MAGLRKTEFVGRICWLGVNPDREASLRNRAVDRVDVSFEGFAGESRLGLTRPSCVRVRDLYPEGTTIRNSRQITILSQAELDDIQAAMGLDTFNPEWIGANMVLTGIPDLTHLPPGSRLQSGSGCTLTLDIENGPCNWPGKVIDEDRPGFGKGFKTAARDRRGVLAWVERGGQLKLDDALTLFVPDQRPWQPEAPV